MYELGTKKRMYERVKSPVKARFIGKSGCGFVTGVEYHIRTKISKGYKDGILMSGEYLWVYDVNSSAMCPYSRLETFLENWEIL